MKVDISIGELVDKITILEIKLEKVKNEEKLKNIKKEYDRLLSKLDEIEFDTDSKLFNSLKEVNENLWSIEDRIRTKESKKEFDDEFIRLARSVYIENDRRAELKREINLMFNSDLTEEKEYVKY